MQDAARRRLEQLSFLSRSFALLVGAIAGGQVYVHYGSLLASAVAALAAWAVLHFALAWLLERSRRVVEAEEAEEAERPTPPPRPLREPPRRRVLTDRDDED